MVLSVVWYKTYVYLLILLLVYYSENDDVAMSSRNAFITKTERPHANQL